MLPTPDWPVRFFPKHHDSWLRAQFGRASTRALHAAMAYSSRSAARRRRCGSLSPPGYPGDHPCPTKGAAIQSHNDEDQGTLQRGTLGVRQERCGEDELH